MTRDGQVFRPAVGRPKTFDTNVQDIASAAHLRGVVLMRQDQVVGLLEAAELCRTLRAAHAATRVGEGGGTAETVAVAHAHVEQIANSIAVRLGVRGAVVVTRSQWNLIGGYARWVSKRKSGR